MGNNPFSAFNTLDLLSCYMIKVILCTHKSGRAALFIDSLALLNAQRKPKKGDKRMSGKFKYLLMTLLLAFLPLISSGCYFCEWYEDFCFDLTYPLEPGKEFALYEIVAKNQYVLPAGNVSFSGQLYNMSASYPKRLSIICSHYNASGDLLDRKTWPLNVNKTSGRIRKKIFNLDQLLINDNDRLSLSVKSPSGLTPSSLTFRAEYKKL